MKKLKLFFVALVSMFVSLTAVPALAAAPDMAPLTSQVDFSSVTTGIMAVAGALITVYIVWKGAKMIIAAVKGG